MTNSADSVAEHRANAPSRLELAVLTVSDTRTLADDASGLRIVELAEAAGHRITTRGIVRDEPDAQRRFIEEQTKADVQAILITGGTGISPRDQTHETVSALLTKTLPGFGELFRMLSYEQIGPACILSRAVGGLVDRTVVLLMPGSRAAVELAMNQIILPELPHLVREARRT